MSAEGDELSLVEGEPAFILDEGIAYVRGWMDAQQSVVTIKAALAELGQDGAMPYLRADVNAFGRGIVELGRVTPQTAILIAKALCAMASHTGSDDGRAA